MAQRMISVQLKGLPSIINNLARFINTAKHHVEHLPMVCALDYVELVRKKIMEQDFTYTRLSDDYKKWKDLHYPSAKTFWHLGGDLVQAIQAVPFGTNSWAGTILHGVMDSGGKSYGRTSRTEILKYALSLEEGSSNIPARPLFGPAIDEYINGGFQKRVAEVKTSFIQNWKK